MFVAFGISAVGEVYGFIALQSQLSLKPDVSPIPLMLSYISDRFILTCQKSFPSGLKETDISGHHEAIERLPNIFTALCFPV